MDRALREGGRQFGGKRVTMSSMDIPGLSTLYAILKRHIEVKNDALAQRQELAHGLLENCQKWSEALLSTFDAAVKRWENEGQQAAEREIVAQEEDFMKLQ